MMRTAFHSDRGPRSNLEDAARATVLGNVQPAAQEVTILVVCDGVGGQQYGEVAAMLGTEHIIAQLTAFFIEHSVEGPIPAQAILDSVGQALREANRLILGYVEAEPRLAGMATTAVCAVVTDGIAYVGWAGDSRCYTFADGRLRQVTEDHSEVQQLIDAGLVKREHANRHPLAHVITHHLGQADGFAVGLRAAPIAPGSLILLCTDGLTDVVTEEEIADHLRRYHEGDIPLDQLPRQLVSRAIRSGTRDNVTILCGEHHPESLLTLLKTTRTSAYPVQLARTLRLLSKENGNVRTHGTSASDS